VRARAPPGVLTCQSLSVLTRMVHSACALTACEPFGELTWGELTLSPRVLTACVPWAAQRASPGGGHPCPDSVRPEDLLVGQDPRIILRLVKGQSLVRRIERESSDGTAKGIEQCRGESRSVGGAVPRNINKMSAPSARKGRKEDWTKS
jgi:hypothetical protein